MRYLCLVIAVFLSATSLMAKNYYVDQNSPAASDEGNGTADIPFLTINKAAQVAHAGDSVIVHAGIYRETVLPLNGGTESQPVVYTAAPGEEVIIKGSDIFDASWNSLAPQIYTAPLPDSFFAGYNPFRVILQRVKNIVGRQNGDTLTLGQVFVNGKHYTQMAYASEVDTAEGSWYYNWTTRALKVHITEGTDLSAAQIELTTRERIFVPSKRGLGYIHVIGFTMEHCGNQFPSGFWSNAANAQAGALGAHSGHHWVIRDNTIRWAKNIGMDIGSETDEDLNGEPVPPITSVGYHLVENNHISDCGACGIAGYKSYESVIRKNRIERINYLKHTAPETGGMKFHLFFNGLIEQNTILDNQTMGIWLDNQYKGSRVSRNLVVNCMEEGIMCEMGFGPVLIDNNIIANTKKGLYAPDPKGDGFYCHDASGMIFVHNLVFGSEQFGAYMRIVTNRKVNGKLVEASDIKLFNNIFLDNAAGNIMLPYPGSRAKNNESNANLSDSTGIFVISTYGGNHPYDGATRLPLLEIRLTTNCAGAEPVVWTDREDRTPFGDQQYGLELGLEQWQCMMNYGLQSQVTNVPAPVLEEPFNLRFSLTDTSAWMTGCSKIAGVDTDYFGYPVDNNPLPGPFQGLFPGEMNLNLATTSEPTDSFSLSIATITHGNIRVDPERTKFAKGEPFTLTAEPAEGFSFTGWTEGLTGSSNPMTIGLYSDLTVGAGFGEIIYHHLQINQPDHGSISVSPEMESYPDGTSITLTATPDEGYNFSSWGGDISGTENPLTITLVSDITVDAMLDPTAIKNQNQDMFSVYPNPARNRIFVHLKDEGSYQLQVMDLTGKIVYSSETEGIITQIPVSIFEQGIYILKLFTGKEIFIQKIVIESHH